MKPLLLITLFFFFVAMGVKDKTYKVELPLAKWERYFNGLEVTKQQIKNSDIQARAASYIIDSVITPLTNDMAQQLNQQLDTTKKK